MIRLLLFLIAAVVCARAADSAASGAAVEKLKAWLAKPAAERNAIAENDFAKAALTKADAELAAKSLWEDRAKSLREARKAEMAEKIIHAAGKEMKFDAVEFGSKDAAPSGGRSLFISMHGGGNAPAKLNDSQWENQVRLARAYKPAEGFYVAPREPTNSWNLWHEAHIDALFDRLIEDYVALENVNPNRVYILGYSAGGDGVYQLGPRMADRWAAAAMMAGHPNETSPLGLRNVPFAIQVGALDDGFNRNKVAAEWGKKLDDLREADPGGYEHFVELHEGKHHWMELADRKAIPWMEKFTRQPIPDKVVWKQDDVVHTQLYWLAVSKDVAKRSQEIVAERKGQTFTLTAKDVPTFSVLLNDAMCNLDEPVTVTLGDQKRHEGPVNRTIATLARTLEERGDRDLIFSAEVKVATP